jgi:hypothetical protein
MARVSWTKMLDTVLRRVLCQWMASGITSRFKPDSKDGQEVSRKGLVRPAETRSIAVPVKLILTLDTYMDLVLRDCPFIRGRYWGVDAAGPVFCSPEYGNRTSCGSASAGSSGPVPVPARVDMSAGVGLSSPSASVGVRCQRG